MDVRGLPGEETAATLYAQMLIHVKVWRRNRFHTFKVFNHASIDARVARIYNREGVLQNTSEPVDRLEHVLDWRYALRAVITDHGSSIMFHRPSGNLIVSSQRLPHRHDIVFFERNGLRHGEFTLRGNKEHKVLEVSWNSDSTVLAIWLEIKVSADKYKKSGKFAY